MIHIENMIWTGASTAKHNKRLISTSIRNIEIGEGFRNLIENIEHDENRRKDNRIERPK